jgi:prevent-host-death family protein
MTSEIPVTQAREELADLINRVAYGRERIVLTRHSRPVAVIVPPADLAVIEERERQEGQAGPSAGEGRQGAGITYIGLGSDPGGSVPLSPAALSQPPDQPPGVPGGPPVAARHQPPGTPRD